MNISIGSYRLIFHCLFILVFAVGLPLTAMTYASPEVSNVPSSVQMLPPGLQLGKNELIQRWMLLSTILIPFYFANAYFFVPRYLVTSQYRLYLLFIILSFIVGTALTKLLESNFMITPEVLRMPFQRSIFPMTLFPMSMLFGLGTSFEMIINWEKQKRNQEAMAKEKITAELSFLKSQINPHFLFNTLNNIYSLSERNSINTGQSILLLSNLMRYMLYETTQGKIPLAKEIKHLEEYIALQKLRIPSSEPVSIQFNYSGNLSGILLEPLLFIPFVENSFKHGISYNSKSFIVIEIKIDNELLYFKAINSKKNVNGSHRPEQNHKGIGIVNTVRRLELLYPGKHTLNIYDEKTFYNVELTINLLKGKDFIPLSTS
jgi:two-component system, LytTR family, sensor kinase